nr:odorant binding protein 21 [Pachyrhinus yasumatsui]
MKSFKIVCTILFFVVNFTTIHVFAEDENRLPLVHNVKKEVYEKCLQKVGSTIEQIKEPLTALRSSSDGPVDKNVLCFIKCIMEDKGLLNSSGEIIINKVKERLASRLTESRMDEIVKCLEKIEKVVTCEDMKQILTCRRPH